jgi:hypothetical protein
MFPFSETCIQYLGSQCHALCTLDLEQLWKKEVLYFGGAADDDSLRIKFQVVQGDKAPISAYLHASFKAHSDAFGKLLKSGWESDFTIWCGATRLMVHKVVLATLSPVFKRLFETDKKVVVEVNDVDSDTMRRLLEFIYTSKVEPQSLGLGQLARLIHAADKYGLIDLKTICFKSITRYISFADISEIAMVAHKYGAPEPERTQIFEFCIM